MVNVEEAAAPSPQHADLPPSPCPSNSIHSISSSSGGGGGSSGGVNDDPETERAVVIMGKEFPMNHPRLSRGLLDTIGSTPIVELVRINPNPQFARVFVKLEFLNPSGSIKDRIVKHIIETFEQQGRLKAGATIVENSSGNTAAAVAMISALKGYKSVLVVPHKCSIEKQNALRAFGARVIVTPPDAGKTPTSSLFPFLFQKDFNRNQTKGPGSPLHYEQVAIRLEREIEGAVRLDQYNNPLNVEAHYLTTGPEIFQQLKGEIDVFVAGGSTGGTITGVSRYLKEHCNRPVKVALVDPKGSSMSNAFLRGVYEPSPGSSQIEGIGKNYKVNCFDPSVLDETFCVSDRDAFMMARRLAQEEGILVGGSSGANVWAALQIAASATKATNIVTVLPDGGIKYLSKIFNPDWLLLHQIISETEFQEMNHCI